MSNRRLISFIYKHPPFRVAFVISILLAFLIILWMSFITFVAFLTFCSDSITACQSPLLTISLFTAPLLVLGSTFLILNKGTKALRKNGWGAPAISVLFGIILSMSSYYILLSLGAISLPIIILINIVIIFVILVFLRWVLPVNQNNHTGSLSKNLPSAIKGSLVVTSLLALTLFVISLSDALYDSFTPILIVVFISISLMECKKLLKDLGWVAPGTTIIFAAVATVLLNDFTARLNEGNQWSITNNPLYLFACGFVVFAIIIAFNYLYQPIKNKRSQRIVTTMLLVLAFASLIPGYQILKLRLHNAQILNEAKQKYDATHQKDLDFPLYFSEPNSPHVRLTHAFKNSLNSGSRDNNYEYFSSEISNQDFEMYEFKYKGYVICTSFGLLHYQKNTDEGMCHHIENVKQGQPIYTYNDTSNHTIYVATVFANQTLVVLQNNHNLAPYPTAQEMADYLRHFNRMPDAQVQTIVQKNKIDSHSFPASK